MWLPGPADGHQTGEGDSPSGWLVCSPLLPDAYRIVVSMAGCSANSALVVLTMLFASERTWKHHYVTLMLPYAYLVYRACVLPDARSEPGAALQSPWRLSALLIATTSHDIGGLFAGEVGHEIALAYGMFFWGAVVLYGATAWRVCRSSVPPLPKDSRGPRSLQFRPPPLTSPLAPRYAHSRRCRSLTEPPTISGLEPSALRVKVFTFGDMDKFLDDIRLGV